jgi:hypothetical protein
LYLFHPSSQSSKHPVSHPEKPEKEGKNTKWYNNAREDPALEHQGHEKKGLYAQKVNWRIFKKRRRECPRGDAKKKMPNRKK